MKILVIVPYFIPEIGSAAHIYFDLTKALRSRGHEVDVITSYPRKFNTSGNGGGSPCPVDEEIEGVQVHRCVHGATRDNIVLRGMEHFLLPRRYYKKYQDLGKRFDVCLVHMPPLPMDSFVRRMRRDARTPCVLNYQDFHPQELTDVGVMKNRLFIRFMERLEKAGYNDADHIVVITDGGISYVRSRGCQHDRVSHIYNGASLADTAKFESRRDFKARQGIEDKVLVTYAGILSPFQGIDNILDAAKQMSAESSVVFYIIGDGMIRENLEKRVREESISNVRLLPLQPREEYLNIINSTDISLVSLDRRMGAPCLPGKLTSLLAVRQPVIAIVPDDSETARVVRSSHCGLVVEPGDVNGLVTAIKSMEGDPELRARCGDMGRKFMAQNMSLENNAARYERAMREAIGNFNDGKV